MSLPNALYYDHQALDGEADPNDDKFIYSRVEEHGFINEKEVKTNSVVF